MPFAFGNTLRAFEEYSYVMYGYDSISGWPHILSVMPEDARERLNGAKAQVDFLINLWFLSHLIIIQYLALIWWSGSLALIGVPILAVASAAASSYWARLAAVQWGQLFKASFDLYLPELHDKLRLIPAGSEQEERAQWTAFNQAIMHRNPDLMPERKLER